MNLTQFARVYESRCIGSDFNVVRICVFVEFYIAQTRLWIILIHTYASGNIIIASRSEKAYRVLLLSCLNNSLTIVNFPVEVGVAMDICCIRNPALLLPLCKVCLVVL